MTKKSLFIRRTFDLAHLSRGRHSPNPMVGAVIAHQGKIIGEGYHPQFGSSHAEINAIKNTTCQYLFKEATIYVSLEPCFHTGKTPPCVEAIKANQFKEVVISIQDLNPKTAGQSIQALQSNGQRVFDKILPIAGQRLIRHFATNIQKKRPYIILKYAVSADGFIGQKGQQVWLSNAFSKRLVHLWRSKLDAILVGGNTVRIDNPQLSARYFEKQNPIRIVLSKSGDLPHDAIIFDGQTPTLIATSKKNIKIPHSEILPLQYSENYLKHLMEDLLAQKNIGTLLIEGGRQTLQSFIDAGLWDEARIIKTKKILGHGILQPNLKQATFSERFEMGSDEVFLFKNK